MTVDPIEEASFDDWLPAAEGQPRRQAPRRAGRARHTESLRASLDRVLDRLDFAKGDGVTSASLELGITFKRARLAAGLTQEELGGQVGLSQSAISAIEGGKGPDGPTWATIRRLCEVLRIEPSFLPAQADATESKVRYFKASKAENAPVRQAELGDTAVALALGLITPGGSKKLRDLLKKAFAGKGAGTGKPKGASQLWSIASHTGTRIKAIDPMLVIALDKTALDMRPVNKVKADHFIALDNILFVAANGSVDIGNTSGQNVVVFTVPAARFVEDERTVTK